MKPIEIPPGPFPSRPRRTFEVRLGDYVGAVVGSIQADTFLQAAGYASRQFFNGSGDVKRATGWGDAPGTFLDRSDTRGPVLFYIAEPGVTAQHPIDFMPPPAESEPQPKRKRR
jgi:hypothetical protein